MYFASRLQAGRMLADKLVSKYRHQDCVVVALNDGGVVVGSQIASKLHCVINMILTEEISLPREPVPIAGISSDGSFIYNPEISGSELDEIVAESRGEIEQQKLTKMHEMNRVIGRGGLIKRDFLTDRNVILVADGLKTNFSLELAMQYLKPIKIKRLIIATPLASVRVVDWMHVYADEICCLSVPEEYNETNRYYDQQDVPDRKTIVASIENLISNWK